MSKASEEISKLSDNLFDRVLGKLSVWIEQAPGLFLLGLIGLSLLAIGTSFIALGSGWSSLLNAFKPSATVFEGRTIVTGIKPMGELVTVSYQLATIDNEVIIQRGLLNACQQSAKYAFVVEIQAGTDLTNLRESDVVYDEETNTYTITVPQPHLTSCNVYEDSSRYDRQMPLSLSTCMRHTDNEFKVLGEYQVVGNMRQRAIAEGILEQARTENEDTLVSFLSVITDSEIVLKYGDEDPVHSDTCNPVVPDGWEIVVDENKNTIWKPLN
jgi:hypothetical protein